MVPRLKAGTQRKGESGPDGSELASVAGTHKEGEQPTRGLELVNFLGFLKFYLILFFYYFKAILAQ